VASQETYAGCNTPAAVAADKAEAEVLKYDNYDARLAGSADAMQEMHSIQTAAIWKQRCATLFGQQERRLTHQRTVLESHFTQLLHP
jgi:hypothetical protein